MLGYTSLVPHGREKIMVLSETVILDYLLTTVVTMTWLKQS